MDQNKVDGYLSNNGKYFPSAKMSLLKDKLLAADDSKFTAVSSVSLKDPMTMLIVSLVVGVYGVDRFMLGDMGMGILKLLTGGGCGILAILDWFSIQNKTREKNFEQVMSVL